MDKEAFNKYIILCRKYAHDKEFMEFLRLHLIRHNMWVAELKLKGMSVELDPFEKLIVDLSEID